MEENNNEALMDIKIPLDESLKHLALDYFILKCPELNIETGKRLVPRKRTNRYKFIRKYFNQLKYRYQKEHLNDIYDTLYKSNKKGTIIAEDDTDARMSNKIDDIFTILETNRIHCNNLYTLSGKISNVKRVDDDIYHISFIDGEDRRLGVQRFDRVTLELIFYFIMIINEYVDYYILSAEG